MHLSKLFHELKINPYWNTYEKYMLNQEPIAHRLGNYVRNHKKLSFTLLIFHNIDLRYVFLLLSFISSTNSLVSIFQSITINSSMPLLFTKVICFLYMSGFLSSSRISILISPTNNQAFSLTPRSACNMPNLLLKQKGIIDLIDSESTPTVKNSISKNYL